VLREKGALNGCIVAGDKNDVDAAIDAAKSFPGLKGMDLAKEVTTDKQYTWNQGTWDISTGYKLYPNLQTSGRYHVVAYDYGVKHNILRKLADRGCRLTVVPAQTPAEEVIALQPDGVFLSNGPGDPEPCDYALTAIQKLLDEGLPMFGICLGHQLLALASGAKTVKMKFGHHGANHPVKDLQSNVVMITSQNHGFAVDENSLPDHLLPTHRSLFDGSLQGIHRTDTPAFSFQGHPEASPGPHDVSPLFDHFIELMDAHKTQAQ
jgi:carbamoyl-phosphate synthase small subunit